MGFWTIFGACFAALWAVCSVITIPIAHEFGKDIIQMEGNILKGCFAFLVMLVAGPLILGSALLEFLESRQD